MFLPFGLSPVSTTSAPSSSKTVGATLYAAPLRAVDNDLEPLQGKVSGKGVFQIDDIAPLSVIDTPRPAYFRMPEAWAAVYFAFQDEFFDVVFGFIGKFETVASEYLDAVILVWIMRGGNDYAGIGTHAARNDMLCPE